ncbi:MAG: hypothetical protein PWQ18_1164 [Clostridia bacterium]|nr:hypothetical protein [Clostridia bacterium]
MLTFSHRGISNSQGLLFGSTAAGQLLARRNLLAIAVQGRGSIELADVNVVLEEARRAVTRWRETGLAGGNDGCLACHGGCHPTEGPHLEGTAGLRYGQVAVNLWLAAGICPQLITSGAGPWHIADLEKLLGAVTGCNFTGADLWSIAHRIQKADTALRVELRGPVY